MTKALGACDGNAHAAAILCAERLPRWYHPNDKVITHVEHWFVDIGYLNQ
jgi:hypothetical protein